MLADHFEPLPSLELLKSFEYSLDLAGISIIVQVPLPVVQLYSPDHDALVQQLLCCSMLEHSFQEFLDRDGPRIQSDFLDALRGLLAPVV